MGLHQAGFDVTGVDIEWRARYPFKFNQADALTFPLEGYDLIWASPPCQAFSSATPRANRPNHPDLIEPIRRRLAASGAFYIIENVPNAPVRPDVVLTGVSFGLKVYRRRHFEINFRAWWPEIPRRVGRATNPDFVTVAGNGSDGAGPDAWRDAMGIDWMTRDELAQAIPPVYARFLGRWAMTAINQRRRNETRKH